MKALALGIISFVLMTLTAVAMLPLGVVTLFRARRLYARIATMLSRCILRLHGVRMRVHQQRLPLPGGEETRAEFPRTQTVYVSNHTSSLDLFILVALGLPNTRFFLSGFLRKWIPLGFIASMMGTFFTVPQDRPDERRRIFTRAGEVLRRTGESVYLSPELRNFSIVPWDQILRGLTNTAILLLCVPTAVILCSVSISWVVLRSKVPGRSLLDATAFLPHALPSIVFSLSALLISLFVLRQTIPLYGTLTLVGIVYTAWWVSFGTRVVNSSLIHLHPELEESASVAGASRVTILRRVLLPILMPALTGAWLWVALLCFRELSMAVLLFSPNNVTLPVVSWSLWLGGHLNQAAVVTLVIVAICAPLILVYFYVTRRVGTQLGYRPS